MVSANRERRSSLRTHSPTLFLVAGTLLIGYAGLNGIEAVRAAAVGPNPFQFGYVVGFLGLTGLYPRFADRQPWLARAGAVAAVLGAVALAGITLLELAGPAGVPSENLPIRPVLVFLTLVGFVLGYLALGVASLRSGVYSRWTGLALLVPGLIVVIMLAHIAAGLDSPGTAFVISAGQAMAHLAIGATLRTESESADREDAEPAADATAQG